MTKRKKFWLIAACIPAFFGLALLVGVITGHRSDFDFLNMEW